MLDIIDMRMGESSWKYSLSIRCLISSSSMSSLSWEIFPIHPQISILALFFSFAMLLSSSSFSYFFLLSLRTTCSFSYLSSRIRLRRVWYASEVTTSNFLENSSARYLGINCSRVVIPLENQSPHFLSCLLCLMTWLMEIFLSLWGP